MPTRVRSRLVLALVVLASALGLAVAPVADAQEAPCLEPRGEVDVQPAGPMDSIGTTVFAALPDTDELVAIDTESFEVIDRVTVGNFPIGVALAGGRAYVANATSNDVSVVDLATFTVIATIAGGFDSPVGPAVANGKVYVGNQGDPSVMVIDPTINTVVDTIAAAGANGVYEVDGQIWVMGLGGDVTVIDPATDAVVTTIPIGDLPIGVTTLDGLAYVTDATGNTVVVVDVASSTVVGEPIPVDGNPRDTVTFAGSVYVSSDDEGTIAEIDPVTRAVTTVFDAGGEDAVDRMQAVGARLFVGGFPVSNVLGPCATPPTSVTPTTGSTSTTGPAPAAVTTPRFTG